MSTIFFLCHDTYKTQSLHDTELLGNYLIVGQSICKNVCTVNIIPGMLVFYIFSPTQKKKKITKEYKKVSVKLQIWKSELFKF